jgi:WXG100 family type VII secretion target
MQIRVITESVRSSAQQMRTVSQQLEEQSTTLKTIRSQIDAAWDGGASVQALSVIRELSTAATELSNQLSKAASAVEQFVQSIESVDAGGTTPVLQLMNLVTTIGPLVTCPPSRFDFPIFMPNSNTTVRVVPEELRSLATQCAAQAEEAENSGAQVQAILSQLQSDWEGNAATKFQEQLDSFPSSCTGLRDSLVTFSEKLTQAADRYEEIDNSF